MPAKGEKGGSEKRRKDFEELEEGASAYAPTDDRSCGRAKNDQRQMRFRGKPWAGEQEESGRSIARNTELINGNV